jgi:hypothetical protein
LTVDCEIAFDRILLTLTSAALEADIREFALDCVETIGITIGFPGLLLSRLDEKGDSSTPVADDAGP